MKTPIKTKDATTEASLPDIIMATSYFIVEKESGRIIERLSTSGKRVLRNEGIFEITVAPTGMDEIKGIGKLTDQDMVRGVQSGRFEVKTQEEILANLDRSKCGIGITGGGDCGGIADCLASLQQNLNPELTMLGVKNAGDGLSSPPEEFEGSRLIIVDELAARDFEGQSSTPFGSSRTDPLEDELRANTEKNLEGYNFFYGTGGDDHLGVLEKIAQRNPDMVVVGTFKSIDGDGCIAGKPAQMLGFNTAVNDYRRAIYAAAQNANTHNQWHVIETFGRSAGKLAYEAGRRFPSNFADLPDEEQRKIEEYHSAIMLLVPEKPTSLRSLAQEASGINQREGNVVIVVAEGFMPPELQSEMDRLANDKDLKGKWISRELTVEDIPTLIQVSGDTDTRTDLQEVLMDRELAAHFGKTVWESKLDSHGNVAKLAGISNFIIQALQKLAGANKVNRILENYEARGATPSEYDQVMGRKVGAKMAQVVNEGVTGGKAVIYFEGMDPFTEYPVVVDLVSVSNQNNLNNEELYPTEELQENGVFWKR